MTPGDQVTVSHEHPRTCARCTTIGKLHAVLASGRVRVVLTVEGKRLIVVTDAHNVKAA